MTWFLTGADARLLFISGFPTSGSIEFSWLNLASETQLLDMVSDWWRYTQRFVVHVHAGRLLGRRGRVGRAITAVV
jgi:hypothetical protein